MFGQSCEVHKCSKAVGYFDTVYFLQKYIFCFSSFTYRITSFDLYVDSNTGNLARSPRLLSRLRFPSLEKRKQIKRFRRIIPFLLVSGVTYGSLFWSPFLIFQLYRQIFFIVSLKVLTPQKIHVSRSVSSRSKSNNLISPSVCVASESNPTSLHLTSLPCTSSRLTILLFRLYEHIEIHFPSDLSRHVI